jgi:hypothetical protein
MKKTYAGSCHCGAVRYEAGLELSKGTVRCNCSICSKARAWLVAVDAGEFRLLKGGEALTDYTFGPKRIHHMFCRTCGIKCFGRVDGPDGQEFHVVLVQSLEGVSDAELAALPIMYLDGRHDDFEKPPAETRHL